MNAPNQLHIRADQFAGMFAPAVVDLFAGCGGWSIGAEQAFVEGGYRDRYVDLMVNHWDVAVGVHWANHSMTEHLRASVWEVDPMAVLPGRRIAYLHASPDCTHFSKARGAKPKKKEIRGLAWVVVDWAKKRRPDVITLENVEEFTTWGPLARDGQPCPRRKGQTFLEWKDALRALGYQVEHKELKACDYGAPTTRKRLFVIARCDGKPIIWPEKTHANIASDNIKDPARSKDRGGNSSRQDLDSRDGDSMGFQRSVRSSDPPRGKLSDRSRAAGIGATASLKPYRTAASCVDWSIPMLSIFATPAEAKAWADKINAGRAKVDRVGVPRRPLKPKTMARIAGGLDKFVIRAARPFIVDIQNYGWNSTATRDIDQPMGTITGNPKGGAFAVVDAKVAPYTVPNLGEREGQAPRCRSVESPLPTVTGTGSGARLVAAQLTTLNHGGAEHRSADPREPLATVTGANDARALVAAMMAPFIVRCGHGDNAATGKHRWGKSSHPTTDPLPTVAGSKDFAVVGAYLSNLYGTNNGGGGDPTNPAPTVTGSGNHTALVAAFLAAFYGEGSGKTGYPVGEPAPTVVGKDRFGLVTVTIDGETYVVTDIAMRMLTPRELARAQGFDDSYIIDRTVTGERVSKADQVKLIGNSVCPQFARAIVRDNVVDQGVLDELPVAAGAIAISQMDLGRKIRERRLNGGAA